MTKLMIDGQTVVVDTHTFRVATGLVIEVGIDHPVVEEVIEMLAGTADTGWAIDAEELATIVERVARDEVMAAL